MKKEKMWNRSTIVLIVLALVITSVLAYCPQILHSNQSSTLYASSAFDKSKIMQVNIIMDDKDWDDMLENALKEEYYACDIEINGVRYYNVGIRPKGNTSLSSIASDDTTDRYSFKVEFDRFQDGQTMDGLDKLCLNNIMSDATYMKEYITYDILSYLGVNSSLYSYASINRNGKYWGLYLAFEGIEESFLQRNYGSTSGNLYKPETMGGGGKEGGQGIQNQPGAQAAPGNKVDNQNGKEFKGPGGGMGSDLAYTDDNYESYNVIWDSSVLGEVSDSDKQRVITALKKISSKENLEDYLDVDQMLRYIAANVVVLNDDSYFGNMLHNYYLYENNGVLSMLPWDYNLAFGAFEMGGNNDATSLINRAIDDVVSSGKLEERPLLAAAFSTEEYKEQYHKYLQNLIEGYFTSGTFETTIQQLKKMISSYVKEDPTAFYTYDEFETGVDTLVKFINARVESIKKQLSGEIPATSADRNGDGYTLVDGSKITVSDMGTFMGGKGGPGGMQGQRPEGMQSPQGEQGQKAEEMQPSEGEQGQNPEGMQPPQGEQGQNSEGMEPPEGMQGQRPEGMEPPEGMQGQRPEGMEPPEGMQGQNPEGMQPPEGMQGQNPEGMQPPEGMQGKKPEGMPFPGMDAGANKENQKQAMIILGISIAVLLVAFIFIRLYKRRKYTAK